MTNNSLFRHEKINIIDWQRNILNEDVPVVQYNVYRRRSDQEDTQYDLIGSVAGGLFEYQDRKVPLGGKYYYVITAVDAAGDESRRSNTAREGS
jgi:fibronectin type 3 domain-containing protein